MLKFASGRPSRGGMITVRHYSFGPPCKQVYSTTPQEVYEMYMAWGDLVIAGRKARIDQLLAEIDRTLPQEWARSYPAEQRAASAGFSLPRSRCYTRKLADREVLLWLLRVTDRRIQGGLVESSDLARNLEDSAAAILDFKHRVLAPAAMASQLTISRDHLGPLSLVPGAALGALWAFYDNSDFNWPPTGDAVRRWRELIISAYQNHAAFNRDELKTWLVEKGWSAAGGDTLIDHLFSDAALLSEYDELRQPA